MQAVYQMWLCGIEDHILSLIHILPVGMMIYIGDVVLRMTQIGKECHSHCAIYKRMGECIMPREGVFAEVLQEGTIHPGDTVITCYPDENRPFQAAVITLSRCV